MRKNKTLHIAAAITMAVALMGYAATKYKALSLPELGEWRTAGIGVGKLKTVQVEAAHPNNGTVIIKRISLDGASTNTLVSLTASSGTATTNLADTIYLLEGDRLVREGTVTNQCRVVLILE